MLLPKYGESASSICLLEISRNIEVTLSTALLVGGVSAVHTSTYLFYYSVQRYAKVECYKGLSSIER